jgi:hypothetical protein
MESRAKALGHAIHPMLIPFPLGSWPLRSFSTSCTSSPTAAVSRSRRRT